MSETGDRLRELADKFTANSPRFGEVLSLLATHDDTGPISDGELIGGIAVLVAELEARVIALERGARG